MLSCHCTLLSTFKAYRLIVKSVSDILDSPETKGGHAQKVKHVGGS